MPRGEITPDAQGRIIQPNWEGEAPAEPKPAERNGSAGASPSQMDLRSRPVDPYDISLRARHAHNATAALCGVSFW
jgi:hypothetical protein